MNFLRLRQAPDAQAEIREYANAISELLKKIFPTTMEAFVDFRLEAMNLSRLDKIALGMILNGEKLENALKVYDLKSEALEFQDKLNQLRKG